MWKVKRLLKLREEDPISYQDAKLTSSAFLEATKEADLPEMGRIVEDAFQGAPGWDLRNFSSAC